MRELDVPAARFAAFLDAQGLAFQRTIAFAGLSSIAVVDADRLRAGRTGVAKGLCGYYHVIDSLPPDIAPGAYGYYWYKRFGPAQHDTWRAAFVFEAQTLDALAGNPCVAEIWHVRLDADIPYYVMRYYERGSLAAYGAAHGWDLPASFVLNVARDLATGLQALHDLDIVHRDLNPENVLLSGNDRVVIADLGCARLLTAPPKEPRRRPDEFHWAPEYADAYDVAGVEADVYSLGVLLHLMAVGRMPRWGGPSARRGGRLPAAFGGLVDSCLDYEPKSRPESMSAILADLATM